MRWLAAAPLSMTVQGRGRSPPPACRHRRKPHNATAAALRAQGIGIRDAAWQQQRIVVPRVCIAQPLVDRHLLAPLDAVAALDLFIPGRDYCGHRTGIFERLARVGQFDLLKPAGGENGDA
jgi:hypothetical protein